MNSLKRFWFLISNLNIFKTISFEGTSSSVFKMQNWIQNVFPAGLVTVTSCEITISHKSPIAMRSIKKKAKSLNMKRSDMR